MAQKKKKRIYPPKRKGTKRSRAKRQRDIEALAKQLKKGGQPEKYQEAYADMAKELCLRGATDADLADFFGVTTVTIWNWSNRHQEFFNAIRVGKDAADERVERALYQTAVGHSHVTEKVYFRRGKAVKFQVREQIAPNDRAQRFWLTNRKRHEWKERQETGFDPDQPLKIVVEGGLPKSR